MYKHTYHNVIARESEGGPFNRKNGDHLLNEPLPAEHKLLRDDHK